MWFLYSAIKFSKVADIMTIKDTIEDVLLWLKGEKEEDLVNIPLYTKEELKELERDKGLDKYR